MLKFSTRCRCLYFFRFILGFNGVFLVASDVPVNNEVYDDFVNLEIYWLNPFKVDCRVMVCVRAFIEDECMCMCV